MSSEEKPKLKTLLVYVGTGGVFYHGLTMMSGFMARRSGLGVILLDDDVIEEKNKMRQWANGVGKPKADIAELTVRALNQDARVLGLNEKIKDSTELFKHVLESCKYFAEHEDTENVVEKIFVLHSPDNHLCRTVVHSGCSALSTKLKSPVVEVTGGNTLTDGYGYSCIHQHTEIQGNFMKRHPDILHSAEKEIKRLESPLPCGSLGEGLEQNGFGNLLTASCMWNLAEEAVEGKTGEKCWRIQEDGRIEMWTKEVK